MMKPKFRETVIYPEGFLGEKDCLIFEENLWRCGDAVNGMSVQVGIKSGGGVIKNEDLIKLKNAINRHLYKVKKGEL